MILYHELGMGRDISGQVRTGTIGVNCYKVDHGSPFGGFKSSGIGRERFGRRALDAAYRFGLLPDGDRARRTRRDERSLRRERRYRGLLGS
jgi:hypothetical protein